MVGGEGPNGPCPPPTVRRWPLVTLPLRRALCIAVLAFVAAVAAVTSVGAQEKNWTLAPDDEALFIEHINAERAAVGLGPLVLDTSMRDAARSWTYWMSENLTLAHADDIVTGAPADWAKVGENVGRGGTLEAVMELRESIADDGVRTAVTFNYGSTAGLPPGVYDLDRITDVGRQRLGRREGGRGAQVGAERAQHAPVDRLDPRHPVKNFRRCRVVVVPGTGLCTGGQDTRVVGATGNNSDAARLAKRQEAVERFLF